MFFERKSPTEFHIRIVRGNEIADSDAGSFTVPHPRLRAWIKANAETHGITKFGGFCIITIGMAPERIADAERFLTMVRVMGKQALETIDG